LKQNEIDIFRHYGDVRLPRLVKDAWIFRTEKIQEADAVRLNSEFFGQPRRDRGRKLSVDPNDHATSTG